MGSEDSNTNVLQPPQQSQTATDTLTAPLSRRSMLRAAAAASIGSALLAALPQSSSARLTSAELVWAPLNDFGGAAGVEQNTYSPRFAAYLARLLLNYDDVSSYWWETQLQKVSSGTANALAKRLVEEGSDAVFGTLDTNNDKQLSEDEFYYGLVDKEDQTKTFSNFQASVMYGLRKYQGKDGVRQLFRLMVEEFGETLAARRQIALLFSLMDDAQPVELIKRLIAETDNGGVINYRVTFGGSGYSSASPPAVHVEAPPFLDDAATAKAVLVPTGRIFRVTIVSPGKEYVSPPQVTITPPRADKGQRATAIATLKGDRLAGIVITNPGSGYALEDDVKVIIAPPSQAIGPGEFIENIVNGATATVVLDMMVGAVQVVNKGSGYGVDLPLTVTVDPPPTKVEYANFGQTAKVEPIMSAPPEGELLLSWLPPASLEQEVTELLPNNLVPKLDPCLGKFYISPIQVQDPNYCIYYDNSEFQVYPSQRLAPYFSFLDGPRARYPVEKERPLDLSVFLRFAACGATCGATAHALLIPIDVVKTRMQSDSKKYPGMVSTFNTLLRDEGKDAFLLGAGATIIGYFVYGGVSFGLTEYFKRKFVEVCGPTVAALYPVPILLFASASAAVFAATAVTPFETLRIKAVTSPGFPKTLVGGLQEVARRGQTKDLFNGVPVLLLAEIPFMMAKFAVFDATSKLAFALLPQASESVTGSLIVSLCSGMLAGVAASIVSQPSDTILVAVSGERESVEIAVGDGGEAVLIEEPPSGAVDILGTVRGVLEEGGVPAFFKGLFPRAIKSAINIAVQFFLYDFFKRLAHVGPDDIKVFFDVMSGLEIGLEDGVKDAAEAAMISIADMIEKNVR